MEGKHGKKIIMEKYPKILSRPAPCQMAVGDTSPKEKVKQKMATEVLRQKPCHDTPIKTHQVEVAGCVEHPAALLPARGSKGPSRTSLGECTQIGRVHRCTPFGLTGSPRIGPYCEQSHSREVKTNEGEKQQVILHQGMKPVPALTHLLMTSKRLVRGVPDERGTPEHLSCREVQKMNKKNIFNDQELPPLPDRAIKGLDTPWSSPTGEPFHTVHLWEFTNLYVLLGEKDWLSLSKYLKGVTLSTLSRQLKIGYTVLSNIRDNRNQSIVVPNLRKLCEEAELNLNSVERSIQGVRFNTRGS